MINGVYGLNKISTTLSKEYLSSKYNQNLNFLLNNNVIKEKLKISLPNEFKMRTIINIDNDFHNFCDKDKIFTKKQKNFIMFPIIGFVNTKSINAVQCTHINHISIIHGYNER